MFDGTDVQSGNHLWGEAAREFCRLTDNHIRDQLRDRVLPWERKVGVGQVDFWRVHAYALDRLDDLLAAVLPHGDFTEDGTWRGRNDEHGHWIEVSFSGNWHDALASKRGHDLVGLVAHIYRMSRRRAAIRLARLLGIGAVRHG
jgi:hypothetical protein